MIKLQRGFTIVELLIVIVVIGILAALVLNSFSDSQRRARNTQMILAVKDYQKALKNIEADTGRYPYNFSAWHGACLGDGYTGNCWSGDSGTYSVNTDFDTLIKEKGLMGVKPKVPTKMYQFNDTNQRSGIVYFDNLPSVSGRPDLGGQTIEYFLEGAGQSCGVSGATANGATGGGTFTNCVLKLSDPQSP